MATIKTIGSAGGRDYPDVATWHSFFAAGGWEGQCYNDSEFILTSTQTIGGTSGANYEKLSCATGQSAFDNAANPLKYDVTKGVGFKCSVGYVDPLYSTSGFLTIEGIQLRMANGNTVGPIRLNGASTVKINRCLVQDEQSNASQRGCIGIESSTSVVITNCCLISFNNHGIAIYYSDGQVTAVNCTVVGPSDTANASYAFRNRGGTSAMVIKNCAGFGFSGGFTNMASSTGSNNATDLSAFGFTSTSSLTSKTYANQFTGTASSAMDFKTKGGADLLDAGVTDSTDIPAANDIFQTSRPQGTAWDIGAHELAASGTVYNVSVSEAGSAASTQASAAVFASTVTEAGSAASTQSSQAILPSAVAISAAAADSPSTKATLPSTVTEAGSALDSPSSKATYPSAVTNAASAADTVTNGSTYAGTITESGTAAETQSNAAVLPSALTDSASAADSQASQAILPSAVNETGAATTTQNSAGVMSVSQADAGSAADTVASAAILPNIVTESAPITDQDSANGPGTSIITEVANAQDTVSASMIRPAALSDSAPISDLAGASVTIAAAVVEAITASDQYAAQLAAFTAMVESAAAMDSQAVQLLGVAAIQEQAAALDAITQTGTILTANACNILHGGFRRRVLDGVYRNRVLRGGCC